MFSVLALLLSLHLLYVQATVTLVQKSYLKNPVFTHEKSLVIEDGHCTGYVADVLPGLQVASLEVLVLEPQRENFATVVLKTPLRSVQVYRKPNHLNKCPGRAKVHLRFGSGGPVSVQDAAPSV